MTNGSDCIKGPWHLLRQTRCTDFGVNGRLWLPIWCLASVRNAILGHWFHRKTQCVSEGRGQGQGQGQDQGQGPGKNKDKMPKKDNNKADQKSGDNKTFKIHPDQEKHDARTCWEEHPELTPGWAKLRAKNSKEDAPNAKVSNAETFWALAFNAQALIKNEEWETHIAATTLKARLTQSIWIVNSDSSHTMIFYRLNFIEYSPLAKHVPVETVNGYQTKAVGMEKMLIDEKMPDGTTAESTVSDVLHVPKLSLGLLSIRMLIKKTAKVIFEDDVCRILNANGTQMMHAIEHRGQYKIQQFRFQALVTSFATKSNEPYRPPQKRWPEAASNHCFGHRPRACNKA